MQPENSAMAVGLMKLVLPFFKNINANTADTRYAVHAVHNKNVAKAPIASYSAAGMVF